MTRSGMSTKSKIVILGFGSIGPAAIPLLLATSGLTPGDVLVIASDSSNFAVARQFNIPAAQETINRDNYASVLEKYAKCGDILVNLAVGVSSPTLIEFCIARNITYLDTGTDAWIDDVSDETSSTFSRRESMKLIRSSHKASTTSVMSHGANPGLVSHFVKIGIREFSAMCGEDRSIERIEHYAPVADQLGIDVIHITERDTQVAATQRLIGEYVSPWSVDGYLGEMNEFVEFPRAVDEPAPFSHVPFENIGQGKVNAIRLKIKASAFMTTSWEPLSGPYSGFVVPHPETYSIAELLACDRGDGQFRHPTVAFVYRPCPDALESALDSTAVDWMGSKHKRLMMDEIRTGGESLGALLVSRRLKAALWVGSLLDISEVRLAAPHNNATTMQVAAGVVAGVAWAMANPGRGVVEPEELDSDMVLNLARPYLGRLVVQRVEWTKVAAVVERIGLGAPG